MLSANKRLVITHINIELYSDVIKYYTLKYQKLNNILLQKLFQEKNAKSDNLCVIK